MRFLHAVRHKTVNLKISLRKLRLIIVVVCQQNLKWECSTEQVNHEMQDT